MGDCRWWELNCRNCLYIGILLEHWSETVLGCRNFSHWGTWGCVDFCKILACWVSLNMMKLFHIPISLCFPLRGWHLLELDFNRSGRNHKSISLLILQKFVFSLIAVIFGWPLVWSKFQRTLFSLCDWNVNLLTLILSIAIDWHSCLADLLEKRTFLLNFRRFFKLCRRNRSDLLGTSICCRILHVRNWLNLFNEIFINWAGIMLRFVFNFDRHWLCKIFINFLMTISLGFHFINIW